MGVASASGVLPAFRFRLLAVFKKVFQLRLVVLLKTATDNVRRLDVLMTYRAPARDSVGHLAVLADQSCRRCMAYGYQRVLQFFNTDGNRAGNILVGAYRLSELTGNLLPSMAIDTKPLQEPVPVEQGGECSNPFAPTNKIKHLQDFLVSAFFFPNTIPAPKVKI